MRAAIGKHYFGLSPKEIHGPEDPVGSDGTDRFAAWPDKAHDCGGNQMTVVFDTTKCSAQVRWFSTSIDVEKGIFGLPMARCAPLQTMPPIMTSSIPSRPLRNLASRGGVRPL